MLAVGDGNLDCNETFEDCAVVRLQDDPQDITWLLQALYYPRKCGRKGDVIDFEILVSLFETTSKYAFDELRRELVEHMKIMFPTNLDSYGSEESISTIPKDYDAAIAVEMGIKYNIPAIMPLACYEAAFFTITELFNDPRQTKFNGAPMVLDRETERACLLSREKLTGIVTQVLDIADLAENPWTNSETGIECDVCGGIEDSERQVIEQTYRSLELDIFRDFWTKSVNSRSMDTLKKLRGRLSPCCDPRLRSFDQEVCQKIWNRLPEACGYADWNAVLEAQAKSSGV
ncbi:hypothetical protein EWM64_g4086 [Hericium alpestre]|uniref:BTB domain-containing protein n=1 Tax=Hericium alpestre TaxID=135208 RepID=A0A4Z0A0R2_9AGAM|nr:hypothetical protein EWM64_g4086 [Hericium alpestre]